MKTFFGAGPRPFPPWLLGSLALLSLSACATTRGAEEEKPGNSETVDVGYGGVDKDQLSGSVSVVRPEDSKTNRLRTLAEMLMEVPGVRVAPLPGGAISVRIRGTNSFQGSNEPLWVLDGMVMPSGGSAIGQISPTTIESITVLKNPGETAIYGSRGANGVILIKTKRHSGQ